MQPNTIQETEHWIALLKPAGLTVHNQPGNDLMSFLEECGYKDCHAAHRLDVGTSGVILIAKSLKASRKLHGLFENSQIKKTYVGIGTHKPGKAPQVGDTGEWRWSLTQRAESRKNPRGRPDQRKDCHTNFRVVNVEAGFVALFCSPQTGRKHQIRRHAALAGWPLVGDSRYGQESKEQNNGIKLHALRLEFQDPWTNLNVTLEAPAPKWFID